MSERQLNLLREDACQALRNVTKDQLGNKVALLTGASGLIGSHFLAGFVQLQREGAFNGVVHAVTRRPPPAFARELTAHSRITFHRGELDDQAFLQSLPQADIVIHAATYGQPGLFTAHPQATLKLNTLTTFGLLEKTNPDGRFLFLSSSELYSGLANPPYSENQIGTTNTTHARACYIEGKRCGEAICNSYRQTGIRAKSARLALAYGPGTRPGDRRVLNMFIEKALRQNEIKLLDDGAARRTYCYISDAMHMLWSILMDGREAVYNVGGVSRTTIAQLAQSIGGLAGVPVQIPASAEGGMAGAPDDVRLDISRFENEFGRMTFAPLEYGLRRAIDWQRDFDLGEMGPG